MRQKTWITVLDFQDGCKKRDDVRIAPGGCGIILWPGREKTTQAAFSILSVFFFVVFCESLSASPVPNRPAE